MHGGEFVFWAAAPGCAPGIHTVTDTRLYGTARARPRDRIHPKPTHRCSRAAADGALPIAEGTA
ncbi:hypothetical protein SUDANB37_00035 [Streptomyces sp. enrichment culture]